MKTLLYILLFSFVIVACKQEDTEDIGLTKFTPEQQEWLLKAEKEKCQNKYATSINSVVTGMDKAFDQMLLGASLIYEITVKREEKEQATETDIHRGKVKLIDRVGSNMLLYVYDVNNDGTDEIVDQEGDGKFIIYSKDTNRKHIESDFAAYCQGDAGSVEKRAESNTKLGNSLLFKYKSDSSVNNITKTHHALYSYPYFFSLYQYDEVQKLTDTITKTITRRLNISDSVKLSCASLTEKIDDFIICDARNEDTLHGMTDRECDVDKNEPFIVSVKSRITSKANCL